MLRQAAADGFSEWENAEIPVFETKEGKAVALGGNTHGVVYAGRLRTSGGSVRPVAIKRFNKPLTDDDAASYQKAIADLRAGGVRLPKIMHMARLPKGTKAGGDVFKDAEWVQVSTLYGSVSGGSALQGKSHATVNTEKGRAEAVTQLAKIASSGYPPMVDVFEPFKDESKGIVLIDIDLVVAVARQFKNGPPQLASQLLAAVEEVALPLHSQDPEREKLYQLALEAASPQVRAELRKIIPENVAGP